MKCMRRLLPALALSCLTVSADCQTNVPVATSPARRPRIGLALGGGGALGIAHVGVLRKLEAMRIPVDFIAGTSMGAVIGGLYSSGLSPDEIEDLLRRTDWWDILRDQTPYRDLDFRRKEDRSRYLMDLELGIQNFRFIFPHGLAAGQKFNNLLSWMTVNAVGVSSFNDLNIPFRAVATDLRTGKAVVLERGSLATAMRASMAVPGMFTPVTLNGNILVDGGLANNIPVDVVKAMGADIVIAADVGASDAKEGARSEFRTLGDILSRSYAIMQRPKDDVRRQSADILIEPDLVGWSAGDFQKSADLVPRGELAVDGHRDALGRLAASTNEYSAWLSRQRERHYRDITLRSVEIRGNREVPTVAILKRVESKPGDKVDYAALQKDVARIHGMGDFQTVTHRLVPTGKPDEYDLKYDTVEKYWGPDYLHFGLRMESDLQGDSSYSMLFNLRQANRNRLGGESRIESEIGKSNRGLLEWYQPLQDRGYLFVAPSVGIGSELQGVYEDGERIAEYKKNVYGASLNLGTQYKEFGELRGGLFSGRVNARPETGGADLPSVDSQLGALTARLAVDRMDARVFARQGVRLTVEGYFSHEELGATDEYEKLEGNANWCGSLADHTLGVGFSVGSALGSDLPVYDQFLVGGMATIPGLAPGELRGGFYEVARLDYRYRLGRLSPSLGRDIYALAGVHAGNAWADSSDSDFNDVVVGTLFGFAMDTIVGPVAIGWGQAEKGSRQLYFSVGTVF